MRREIAIAVIALALLVRAASACMPVHCPGWDPDKIQNDQGYFELATECSVFNDDYGVDALEYVIDFYAAGNALAWSYEIWGFDNSQILNMDYSISWYGGFDSRIIMQCWDWNAAAGDSVLSPPSIDSDGDDAWEPTGFGWSMDNTWHAPSEYSGGILSKLHTDEVLDAAATYAGRALDRDVIPIVQYGYDAATSQLTFTLRVVTTQEFDYWDQLTWTYDDNQDPNVILGPWMFAPYGPGLDGDGDCDDADIDYLREHMDSQSDELDLTQNGHVDEDDLIYLVEHLVEWDRDGDGQADGVGTERGDFNLDGFVNATDLAIMKASFGDSDIGWAGGNANIDTVVNAIDLAILKSTFGFSHPGGVALPEPMTLAMLAAGAAALVPRWKRQGRRARVQAT